MRGCRDGGRCTGVGAVKRPWPQVPEDTALLVTMWPLITCGHADRMLLAPNQFWVNSFYDKIPIHGAALFTTYCALYHESAILCLSLTVFNGRDNSTTRHSTVASYIVLAAQHHSVVFYPHCEEPLVQCFRTQPLTPIKEVTIETGQ